MHAQRIHPGLFLYVITFNRNIQRAPRELRTVVPVDSPSHLTSAYHPQTYRYASTATHRHTHRQTTPNGPTKCVNIRTLPFFPFAATVRRRRPLFLCPGRPFTIGNLHKRLTEAKLNHTREREKNRRASKLFVCMRESEDTFPVWKRQRKRKRANLDEEEEEQRGRKLAVRGGRGEETRRREGRR